MIHSNNENKNETNRVIYHNYNTSVCSYTAFLYTTFSLYTAQCNCGVLIAVLLSSTIYYTSVGIKLW